MTNNKKILFASLSAVFIALGIGVYLYNHASITKIPIGEPSNPSTSTDSTSTTTDTIRLQPTSVSFSNGKKIVLNIPEHYTITVAAQGFRHPRFMEMSPDGRLFFGEMTSASDAYTGKMYVLDDFNEQTGKFARQTTYLSNLRNPNSLAFYTDEAGKNWLYIALTDKLIRYPYAAGDTAPTDPAQTIATFPDTPHVPPQGYWHLTRTVIIHNNSVYVSIGSSCDSCEENESLRGVIVTMDPDGKNQKIIASGLRNAVGIGFVGNDLFATVNESDKLGIDRPDDVIYKISEGTNYGWPYCYQYQGAIFANTSIVWDKQFDCSTVPLAWATFAPHSAPLGFAYIDKTFTDSALQNSLLVALHGSGDIGIGTGNNIVVAKQNKSPQNFVTGFLKDGKRLGRVVHIVSRNNSSFFITDDFNGALYYLSYKQ